MITPRRPEELGDAPLASNPSAVDDRVARHRARAPRDADLHLRHHRPAQGRAAAARVLDLRGRRDRGHPAARPDDLQYLWLPMAHSFGKVLLAAQLQIGFADRGRRPRPQDRRQPRRRPADVHGRGPAHLREGLRPDRHHGAQAEGGAQGEDLRLGVRASASRSAQLRPQGKEPGGLLAAQYKLADKLVFSKIRERFGGRMRFFVSGSARAVPGHRRVVPRRRPPDPRGLRPDRDLGRRRSSTARTTTGSAPSARRSPAPRSRSPRTARS